MDIWLWWFLISGMSCLFIFSTILLMSLTFQLYTIPQIRKLYRYITIISSLSNTLCIGCDVGHFIWCYVMSGILVSHMFDEIILAADAFYYVGDLALYILLISRVYLTFQETAYALSKQTSIFFGILLSISAICGIYYCIVQVGVKDEDKVAQYNIPAVLTLAISKLVFSISFIALYVYKLTQLTALIYDIDIPINSEITDEDESFGNTNTKTSISIPNVVQMNSEQNKLLTLITKHSVLGSTVIIFNILYWLGYIHVNYFAHNVNSNKSTGVVYSLRVLENFVNVLVLYLSLEHNRPMYYRLCRLCDNFYRFFEQTFVTYKMNKIVNLTNAQSIQVKGSDDYELF